MKFTVKIKCFVLPLKVVNEDLSGGRFRRWPWIRLGSMSQLMVGLTQTPSPKTGKRLKTMNYRVDECQLHKCFSLSSPEHPQMQSGQSSSWRALSRFGIILVYVIMGFSQLFWVTKKYSTSLIQEKYKRHGDGLSLQRLYFSWLDDVYLLKQKRLRKNGKVGGLYVYTKTQYIFLTNVESFHTLLVFI